MQQSRNIGLDGLRGVASVIVLLYHVQYSTLIDVGFTPGFVMVDVFFVLSGYVLTARYGEFATSLKQFSIVRLARIYPLHFLTLAVLFFSEVILFAVTGRHAVNEQEMWKNFFLNLFLLQSVGLTQIPSWNTSSWSISVEFWLNMLWFSAGRAGLLKKSSVYAATWATCSLLLVFLYTSVDVHLQNGLGLSSGLLRGAAGMSVGVLIHRMGRQLDAWLSPRLEVAMLALYLLVWIGAARGSAVSGFLEFVLALVGSPVLVALVARPASIAGRIFSGRFLSYLGEISYSVYLWHLILIKAVNLTIHGMPWTRATLMVVLTALVSAFSYRYIELPGQFWVKRWLTGAWRPVALR